MKTRRNTLATAFVFALAAFALGGSGCKKPEAPQLVPKQVTVTDVSLGGFDMRVQLDAFNPNAFAISVRSLTAHVIVNGNQDLGTVTSTSAIDLPAEEHTLVDAPLSAKWKGAAEIAMLAQARTPVPYTIDGTANVGGESLNIDVPFKLTGTITPAQVKAATQKSLQNVLPALQGLPSLPAVPAH